MANKIPIIVVILLMILVAAALLIVLRGDEDSRIKDKNGMWVKHGNPDLTRNYVQQQHAQEQILMMQQQIEYQNLRISELERDNQITGSKNCRKHERRDEWRN